MKTWLLHGYESFSFGYEASKLWVRIILALGTNHLNFGYESSGYETSVGTKRPVSEFRKPYKLNRQNIIQRHFGGSTVGLERCRIWIFLVEFVKRVPVYIGLR